MNSNHSDLERRVAAIEVRNQRVELDKAWELSLTRRLIVSVITFLVIGGYLIFIGYERPWLNALAAVVAFFSSTLVVAFAKALWSKQHRK